MSDRFLNVRVDYHNGRSFVLDFPIIPNAVCNGDGWHEGVSFYPAVDPLPNMDSECIAYAVNEGPCKAGRLTGDDCTTEVATWTVLNPEALPGFDWINS